MTNTPSARARGSIIGAGAEGLGRICSVLVPYALVGLLLRLVMARLFFLSGQTKIDGPRIPLHLKVPGTNVFLVDLDVVLPREVAPATFQLFETQHANLPIAPDLAAYLLSYGEFVLPICLVLGFATRLTALTLAIATIGFALYVAPALWWGAYVYWVVILLTLVSVGGGAISIDALLRTLYRRERTPAEMP
ncbi:MAG: DoxX family protein [Alphaproteobacteria bacterium]|nr:MAG: DoxX family protein [Alphaproteobacteria bacterium]